MATIVEMINPLTGLPEQVDKLDHTAQEIDDAVDLAPQLSNPNLLDNWYFGNPVDQRQGRVVIPNTTYYSDNTLATAAGTTSAYVTAYRYATGTANGVNYASFKLEDTDTAPTYYAAPENVVRGYTGFWYGIDRWYAYGGVLKIQNDIIELSGASTGAILEQKIENPKRFAGKTVTLSVLGKRSKASWYIAVRQDGVYRNINLLITNSFACASVTFVADSTLSNELAIAFACWDESDVAEIKAAKLELGSQQTLAHQDDNGNWVLNEIPDYGEQLARCQRYFQTFATESLRPTNALDFRPVMRATPALSTITVGEKTLYTASADL